MKDSESRTFARQYTLTPATIVPVSLTVNGVACCQTVWVTDDQRIVVHAQNYSGKSTDWIGLYQQGAPWDQPTAQLYLDGSSTTPPESPVEEGQVEFATQLVQDAFYEARLYQAGTTTPMAVFSLIYVQRVPPTLTLTGAGAGGQLDLAEGQAFLAQIAHAPPASAIDVYAATLQPDGSGCEIPLTPSWQITTGMTSLSLSAPVSPGIYRGYVCRLVEGEAGAASWIKESESEPVVVHAPVLTVNGAGTNTTTQVRSMTPLTATVQWAPDLSDRVLIDALPGGSPYYEIQPLQGNQTVATALFTMPVVTPGTTLEARLLWPDVKQTRAMGPTIVPLQYKIWLAPDALAETLDPIDVVAGGGVTAAVGAEGHVAGDWLGLFRKTAGDGGWISQVFLPAAANGTLLNQGVLPVYRAAFTMPTASTPQEYEIRFFDGASWVRLGASATIRVSGTGTPATTRRLTINGQGAGEPVDTTKQAALVAHLEGDAFGLADRVVLVRQTDGQRLAPRYPVAGQSDVPIAAPNTGGDFTVWWVSDDPVGAVQGPTLVVPGLPGADTLTFYDTDAIGSVRQITDLSGAVIERHDYLPFGTEWPISSSSGSIEHKVKFAGKERDAETALDYFGARYTSANSGRFTTVDPITDVTTALVDPQRWHKYVYVRNNPLRFTDPDGRCIWDGCVGELAVVTGISVGASVVAYIGSEVVGAAISGSEVNITRNGIQNAIAAGALTGVAGGIVGGAAVLSGVKLGTTALTAIGAATSTAAGVIVTQGRHDRPIAENAVGNAVTGALSSVGARGVEALGSSSRAAKIGAAAAPGPAVDVMVRAGSEVFRLTRQPPLPPLPPRPKPFEAQELNGDQP